MAPFKGRDLHPEVVPVGLAGPGGAHGRPRRRRVSPGAVRAGAAGSAALRSRRQSGAVTWPSHDVDNALTGYAEAQHRRRDNLNTERDDAIALRVAEQCYDQGVANFIDVTVARADLLRGQDATA